MTPKPSSTVLRRSVALPMSVVEESKQWAPEDLRGNFNRLVIVALSEYAARRKNLAFEQGMAEMARDNQIRGTCSEIDAEFLAAEADGLGGRT
jgi:hypothetical protein